jgi:glycosyltransferase involved in cell wall biosynthesis
MNPKISIIIPTYNRAHTLRRAINSIILQDTREQIEINIIDDGSTDDTKKVIDELSNSVKINYTHQVNAGVAAARNTGLNLSKGEFICFLDSDDEWMPNKISHQLNIFSRKHNLAMISGYMEDIHQGNKSIVSNITKIIAKQKLNKVGNLFSNLLFANLIGTSSVMLRSDVIHESEISFNPYIRVPNDDWPFWIMIAARYPILISPQKYANRYILNQSLANTSYSISQHFEHLEKVFSVLCDDEIVNNTMLNNKYNKIDILNYHKAHLLSSFGKAKESREFLLKIYDKNIPIFNILKLAYKSILN